MKTFSIIDNQGAKREVLADNLRIEHNTVVLYILEGMQGVAAFYKPTYVIQKID
jgi:hypothetical protein